MFRSQKFRVLAVRFRVLWFRIALGYRVRGCGLLARLWDFRGFLTEV